MIFWLVWLIFIEGCAEVIIIEGQDMGGLSSESLDPYKSLNPPDPSSSDPSSLDPSSLDPSSPDPNSSDPNSSDPNSPSPHSNEPSTCIPGQPISLCTVCGPNGVEITATIEPMCDVIDCSTLSNFRKVSVMNGVECRKQEFESGSSQCQGPGACYTDPSVYCQGAPEEVVLEAMELNECVIMEGCVDQTPPTITVREGETCQQEAGLCNSEGVCVDQTSCEERFNWRYNNQNRLCGEGEESGLNYCDFYVNKENNPWQNGGEVNCNEFCGSMGGACMTSWDEVEDTCQTSNPSSCDDRFNDSICRCILL